MRLTHKYILALAFVSFLTITMSGFHLHADVGEHDEMASHEHDLHHETTHVDISVFEPARGFSQVETFAPVLSVPQFAAQQAVEIGSWKDMPTPVPRRYSRLRRPTRAPPVSA